MKVLSVNTGSPRQVIWDEQSYTTSIFKSPVAKRCQVSFFNIEGDQQADQKNHGGRDKAVYAYPIQYYRHWQQLLTRQEWEMGLFGENLTTDGLLDEDVRIGDIYQVGSVKLQAIQPRFPCYKLNIRFGMPDMVKRFFAEKRYGTYFRVLEEGHLQATDPIELIERSSYPVTIQDVVQCYSSEEADPETLKTILSIPYLPERLKTHFQKLLIEKE